MRSITPGRRLVLAAAVLSSGLWSGCQTNVVNIASEAEFNRVVLQSDRPVLVEFYKDGCATCLALDPGIIQLADEYKGRVVVARFRMLNFAFWVQSWDIGLRYYLGIYPTVILFDHGQEVKRWVWFYYLPAYRSALDDVLARREAPAPAPAPDP